MLDGLFGATRTVYTGAETLADLADFTGVYNRQMAYADSYADAGAGGLFRWSKNSAATPDGAIVLGTGSTGRWLRNVEDHYNVRWFGAKADGVTDDAPAIEACMLAAMAAGKRAHAPAGTYRMASPVVIRPPTFNIQTNVFASGPKLSGDGIGNTIFEMDFSGIMFDIQAQDDPISTFKGLVGLTLEHFTIKQTNTHANTTAIKMRAVYLTKMSQFHIDGKVKMTNGLWCATNYGDTDASNQTIMEQVRIENCKGWGIKWDADFGTNETSFTSMSDVFIQYCGDAGAAPATVPLSGGMLYKGQTLSMRDCCFEINNNVGLYIRGESGLASNVTLVGTTFESNTRRHIYVTGVTSFKGSNIQMYNKNEFKADIGCEFDGASATVRHVEIDGCVVRATSGNGTPNPYTAFKISGTNVELDTCRVVNVEWNDFDHAGQTRFNGWRFNPVPHQCYLTLVNDQIVRLTPLAPGRGNAMPLRLAGPATGVVPSTTGEWVVTSIDTNGEAIAPTTTLLEGGNLAASTRYHVYLWDDDGSRKISLSATAPVVDDVVGSQSGYLVRSGDVAKYWVGCITTTAAVHPDQRFSHVENGGGWLIGSAAYNPGNLVDGDGVTTTITVTGAELGDYARVTYSLDLQGITATAWVSAANTVSVRLQNETGGAIDLAPGILRARVEKA